MKFRNFQKIMLDFRPQIMNNKNSISHFYSNPHFSKQLHLYESSLSLPQPDLIIESDNLSWKEP